MNHRQTEFIFPTPLYITKFSNTEFCDDAVKVLEKFTIDDKSAETKHCWTTHDDLHLRQSFSNVVSKIKDEVKYAFDQLGVIREEEKITCMWANISDADNRHALHPHSNSFMSGVLYLEAPEQPGNIGFRDPRQGNDVISPDYEEHSIFKNRTIEVKPEKGLLIIFPSWLYHGTTAGNFSVNEKRISLSFNIMPKGRVNDFSKKGYWN